MPSQRTVATSDDVRALDDNARVIIDTVPALLAYVDAGQVFRLTNEAYRAWFGAIFGDVHGRNMRDVLGAAAYEMVRHHVETALRGTSVSFEARVPHATGMKWVHTDYVPHVAPDGTVLGFVSQVHDITARKLAEERLSILVDASRALGASIDQASSLRAIANAVVPSMADWAIVFVARDGDVIVPGEVSHVARIAKPTLAAVVDALTPKRGEWDPIRQVIATREHTVFVEDAFSRVPHGDAIRKLHCSSVAICPLVARARAIGALVVGSAIQHYSSGDLELLDEIGRRGGAALDTALLFEAQRHTNDQLTDAIRRLSAADRRKDEFLAMLGHELRNPLAPIVTALDLLDRRSTDNTQRERAVIRRQTHHLTRLLEDLLDVSRVTQGKLQLKLEPTDVAGVIAKAIEASSPLFEQRRHHLVTDVDAGLIVDGDPIRLCQVISNLLTNAAKYTEPGGRIVVSAKSRDTSVVISVEDNGMGISPDLLPDVFELFVQSPRTIDRAQGGLGLGLSLVKSLTRLHGGSVEAHSDGHGHGSRFVVTLPGRSVTAANAPEPSRQRVRPTPRGQVLVVDDNVDAATMLADALRERGFSVAVAHDAPAALQLATQLAPTHALLDIGLPVMDGYELAQRLRATLPDPRLRLIAVTGYGQAEDIARSREAGFDLHFGKPVDIEKLVDALH